MAQHLNPQTGQPERSALDLIEEAVHLLRCSPSRILLLYAVGTLPFVAGILFFCLEARVASNSWDVILPGSFILALLYVWMSGWQAAFAQELWALRLGQSPPVWTWRGIAAMAATQTRWKPWGLFGLPLSAMLLVPWPWYYVFSHNISVLGAGESGSPTDRPRGISHSISLASQHMRQAFQIQMFGHMLYGLMYFNLMLLLLAANLLLHVLAGIESPMNENPVLYFTVPVQLAVCGVTYLLANPIMKAVCLLRCLYGLSRDTGDDLLAGLRNARARIAAREERNRIHAPVMPAAIATRPAKASSSPASSSSASRLLLACALAMLALLSAAPVPAIAQSSPGNGKTPSSAPVAAASPNSAALEERSQQISRNLERVFTSPDYDWRDMNEVKVTPVKNSTVKSVTDYLTKWGEYIKEWIDWYYEGKKAGQESEGSAFWSLLQFGSMTLTQSLILIGALGCIIAICIILLRRTRQKREGAVAIPVPAAPPPPQVNVADEQLLASALPEDEWRALAEKLRREGNLRLALRALYLGTLAHLARRELISIAKAKSVRNYRRELQLRARHIPPVLTAFDEQARDFERIWYGEHPSTGQLFDLFLQRHGNIEGAVHG